MISDGSVGTFCSKIILPASSTTHTDVSFTDTSRPTKCAISSLLPRCSRSPDLDPFIATEGDARSASKAEPQPPRYTIFGPIVSSHVRMLSLGGSHLLRGFPIFCSRRFLVWSKLAPTITEKPTPMPTLSG